MNANLAPEIREVMGALHYRPSVSIILPFEPKMNLKTELMYTLKLAVKKVEDELVAQYPGEMSALVMNKLNTLVKNLNFNSFKKSIALFVSPVFEKVLYLDVQVEAKIIIDESFEIRDLVYSKKQVHKYLVLLLSGKESRMYLGNTGELVRIISDKPEHIDAYVNEVPERTANFSDTSERKEIVMDKFLQHIDHSLDIVLHAYHLPLFVMGTDRIIGHFKQLTKHEKSIVETIRGNYEESSMAELKAVLEPYINDWKKVKEKDLLNQIEEAAGKKKLAVGMKAVWRDTSHKKGQLLVVEKNYMFPAQHSAAADVIEKLEEPYNRFSYIKDAVDDVIESVLDNGGDVEFVDEGTLKEYEKIVLINYY
ncbi:baeRF3 domain-containing protein [Lacibacter sp. H407]|uniref:baeRF3 domain-containing protein n=1 Tax=Lacibacter sp. H407 TaxID=3133423 RepID=UPI0030BD0D91